MKKHMPIIKSISIHGLGYVGATLAGCFADRGIFVVGIDIIPEKIDLLNKGDAPFKEREMSSLILKGIKNKMIMVTSDSEKSIKRANIHIICVGTPSGPDGNVVLNCIFDMAILFGGWIKKTNDFHLIVIRSTVPPGTTEKFIHIIEEKSGKKLGKGFSVVANPEFLREGNSIQDFCSPSFTIIGEADPVGGNVLESLYRQIGIKNNIFHLKLREAEVLKYSNNAFHALKVVFANEIARMCSGSRVDAEIIMDILVKDHKLNLSPYYLKPGFAFGGSCLSKDLRTISKFNTQNILFKAMLASNQEQIDFVASKIKQRNYKKVLMSGIGFKKGTNDFRESQYIFLMKKLMDSGIVVEFIDPLFDVNDLIGANQSFVSEIIPDLSKYQVSEISLNREYDAIIIGCENYLRLEDLKSYGKDIIDLQCSLKQHKEQLANYFTTWTI